MSNENNSSTLIQRLKTIFKAKKQPTQKPARRRRDPVWMYRNE